MYPPFNICRTSSGLRSFHNTYLFLNVQATCSRETLIMQALLLSYTWLTYQTCLVDYPAEIRPLKTGAVTSVFFRRRDEEASQHHPTEHRDRHRRGDEESGDTAGQQGLNWRQHQLKQLWWNVSIQPEIHPPVHAQYIQYPSISPLFCFLSLRFVFPTTRLGPESQFSDFLDGLGPAQIVGRQTLATHPMGKPRMK